MFQDSTKGVEGHIAISGTQAKRYTKQTKRKIILCYQKKGRQGVIKRFGLSDGSLYSILRGEGISAKAPPRKTKPKARRQARKGVGTGVPGAARSKASRSAIAGASDALTYLEHAKKRLEASLGVYRGAGAVLGLVCLAVEALGGE
jgi:hypothetical protein